MKGVELSHEVIDSTSIAKYIAQAQSHQLKYKYKATALLAGHAPLRPYDPIYLTGLADKMSGVWVVISITHILQRTLPYSMKVAIGTTDALLELGSPAKTHDIDNPVSVIDVKPIKLSENDTFLLPPPINREPSHTGDPEYQYDVYENSLLALPEDSTETSSISVPMNKEIYNPTETWVKAQGDDAMCCSCHNGLYGLYTPKIHLSNVDFEWRSV